MIMVGRSCSGAGSGEDICNWGERGTRECRGGCVWLVMVGWHYRVSTDWEVDWEEQVWRVQSM